MAVRINAHNSVTITQDTSTGKAATRINSVLDRLSCVFVPALFFDHHHEPVNRACKSLALARQHLRKAQPAFDLTFVPFHRTPGLSCSNCDLATVAAAEPDPRLFAFSVYKIAAEPASDLPPHHGHRAHINVGRNSSISWAADRIVHLHLVHLDKCKGEGGSRERACINAAGGGAVLVAMSAVILARRRLLVDHKVGVTLVPQFRALDVPSANGHSFVFVSFDVLPCDVRGPLGLTVQPTLCSVSTPP